MALSTCFIRCAAAAARLSRSSLDAFSHMASPDGSTCVGSSLSLAYVAEPRKGPAGRINWDSGEEAEAVRSQRGRISAPRTCGPTASLLI